MCAVGAIAALAVVGMAGSIYQGEAARKAAKYQEAVAKNNATLAGYAAEDAITRGAQEKAQIRREYALTRAKGQSELAAGNIVLGTGSALQWEDSLTDIEEEDIAAADANARRESYAARIQQSSLIGEASMARAGGRNARVAGYLGAGGSALQGVTSYNNYQARAN